MWSSHALASRFNLRADEDAMMKTSLAQAALDNLVEEATKAAENSYSPYSGFKVGAALRLNNGAVITGTNVENVSFGLTICAERSARVRAVSQFGPSIRIEAVAVANLNDAASPPCGACRQMLAEFAAPDTQIVFPAEGGVRTMPFEEVLPLGFDMKLKKTG
jgi:cytidine deaminase